MHWNDHHGNPPIAEVRSEQEVTKYGICAVCEHQDSVQHYKLSEAGNKELCVRCILKDIEEMEGQGELSEENREYIKKHITTTITA